MGNGPAAAVRMWAALPKVAAGGFSPDRKNDGMGNLSVATNGVTTENAPMPGFCETREDAPGVLAVPPMYIKYPVDGGFSTARLELCAVKSYIITERFVFLG